jgi:hypothetical protein
MRRFLLGSVLACLCGSGVTASAQLLNTHAGLGMMGGGGSGGAIAFNAAADLGNVNPGTSLTQAYTVGSDIDRLLIVNVIGDVATGTDDCSGGSNGATYNGTNMTLSQKNVTAGATTDRFLYLFELLAPASGSHNVVITCGSSHFIAAQAADYSGVVADDAVGQASAASATSLTIPITTVATGSWTVATIVSDNATATAFQSCCGSTVTMTQRVIDPAFHAFGILDSAGTVPPGSQSVILELNTGPTGTGYLGIAASYQP